MKIINARLLKLTLLLIVFFATGNLHAQQIWSSFCHVISEQGYAGMKFRYKAFIRTDMEDTDALATLWLRVDRNEKRGFFNNMMSDSPVTSSEWEEFTIEGTFDEDYTQIAFGILTQNKGNFYLDDVRLEVQTKENEWKSIYQTDFETGINDWNPGIGRGTSGINASIKGELSSINPKSGKQSFVVAAKGVPN